MHAGKAMIRAALDWLGFGAAGHSHLAQGHGHVHGAPDPTIATTDRGIWAIKWSFIGLTLTAIVQMLVVWLSGSVALLADTIHNLGDAATAVPLYVAFWFARRKPTERFTYGYGRVEDLAGVIVVALILFSAIVAGYQAVERLFDPRPIAFLGAVAAAGVIGFAGNEAVAVFRIRIGREIRSAALIADGYHARVDGLTSLAVVLGAFGVWLGLPLADPVVGLVITAMIFGIVWQSAKAVFSRMLDGVEPEVLAELRHTAEHVRGVKRLDNIRARWIGHRLHAEADLVVDPDLPVHEGAAIAARLREAAMHHLPALDVLHLAYAAVPPDAHGAHRRRPHDHGDGRLREPLR